MHWWACLPRTLPYTKDDLSAKYGLTAVRAAGKKVILISPSVYAKSFLTNRALIDSLIKLQASEVVLTHPPTCAPCGERLRRLYDLKPPVLIMDVTALQGDKFHFLVKLHGYCFFTYKEEENGEVTSHPLHSLSDTERENIKLLQDNFKTADETEYNVLPFIEAADAVRIPTFPLSCSLSRPGGLTYRS